MSEARRKGFFWVWGLSIHRNRWIVVLVWASLFFGLGVYAQKMPELRRQSFGDEEGLVQIRDAG